MDLRALAGNGPLKRQLEGEQAHRGLSHAYILAGPAGSGKRTLAGLLSAAMVCSGGGEVPCGSCPSCKKATRAAHKFVQAENGKSVKQRVCRKCGASIDN